MTYENSHTDLSGPRLSCPSNLARIRLGAVRRTALACRLGHGKRQAGPQCTPYEALRTADGGLACRRSGEPAVFVLESFEGRDATRIDRIRRLCRSMQNLVACRDIGIRIYPRAAVRTCFASIGATSRYEIALAIAQRIDAFNHRLPPKRRKWMNQDPRQSLFDAAALAITYFAFTGEP